MTTAIVDTATGEFVSLGHDLDAQYIRVTVTRNPDPAREKYSGDPLNGIAAKSAAEITAAATAQQDADAGLQFDGSKMFRAKAISDLAKALGKAPGALTPVEIAAERARILAIYKAL